MATTAIVATCVGCSDSAPTTPEGVFMAAADALRKNDVQALSRLMSEDDQEEARLEWGRLGEKMSDDDRAELDAYLEKLTRPEAEETLFAELRPWAEETQESLAGTVALLSLGSDVAVSQAGADPEDPEVQRAIQGAIAWASQLDITAEDQLRDAISIACTTARNLGIRSAEDYLSLDYDELLDELRDVLAAAKDIAALYQLDVDAILESVAVGDAVVEGDTATLPVTVTLFGESVSFEQRLRLHQGRWYPAE